MRRRYTYMDECFLALSLWSEANMCWAFELCMIPLFWSYIHMFLLWSILDFLINVNQMLLLLCLYHKRSVKFGTHNHKELNCLQECIQSCNFSTPTMDRHWSDWLLIELRKKIKKCGRCGGRVYWSRHGLEPPFLFWYAFHSSNLCLL